MEKNAGCEPIQSLLIVEDDESQLRVLTDILQEDGFGVVGCSTASEALKHLEHLETGVVVLDLHLPDLSGTQLLERLAAVTDKVRVIIHTAYNSYESARDALNLGAFAYVEKAGDPEELLRHVRRASAASLRSYANDLETAVAERTGELRQANKLLETSLKEKEVLLKEIHHRVKNNMQVISSMLNLQARHVKDEEALAMFMDSRNRIKSMALVHDELYKSGDLAEVDFAGYVRGLTDHLFRSCGIGTHVRSDLDIEDVSLGVDKAIPCGLIINELLSNALKHAFPDDRQGRICVRFHSDKDDQLTLIVKDDGVGFPENLDFRKTESLGMQLVVDLVQQLSAEIQLDKDEGTAFRITFAK